MKPINPTTVAPAGPGYSQGVAANGAIYVAGQVAIDVSGQVVGKGDIAAQTRQTLENVRNVLSAGGLGLADVVSTTVYLTDFAGYRTFSQTWCEVFGDHRPARATVKSELVHPDLLIEIQAVAAK